MTIISRLLDRRDAHAPCIWLAMCWHGDYFSCVVFRSGNGSQMATHVVLVVLGVVVIRFAIC